MANSLDVAAYILVKAGAMTAMKLQKLVYYSQAWSLVWKEEPLFNEEIEAWSNGPVVPELYNKHRGSFSVSAIDGGNVNNLTAQQKTVVDAVVEFYSKYTAQQLSDLTHSEKPWLEARQGFGAGERCNSKITTAMLHEYYSGL
jgi:uncharacterized phage-associated protein